MLVHELYDFFDVFEFHGVSYGCFLLSSGFRLSLDRGKIAGERKGCQVSLFSISVGGAKLPSRVKG